MQKGQTGGGESTEISLVHSPHVQPGGYSAAWEVSLVPALCPMWLWWFVPSLEDRNGYVQTRKDTPVAGHLFLG